MLKRITALVMAAIFCMGACLTVFAVDDGYEGYVEVPGNGFLGSNISLLTIPDATAKELEDRVYNAAVNKTTRINISDLNISISDKSMVSSIVYGVAYDHPELYYMETGYGYYYSGEKLTSISLQYTFHASEEKSKAFFSKVDYIIASVIKEGMSDAEKALALHDYIIDTTTYTYDNEVDLWTYPDYKPGDVYTSYAVLTWGVGVCQGYALAYNLLLNRVGIETKYVSSDDMCHGWSLVKIDGNWYHVDVTWDDPIIEGHPRQQIVNHENFLLSDEGIAETKHYGWDADIPDCNDKTYEADSYSFYLTRTEMKYKDGKFYYQGYIEGIYPNGTYYLINNKKYILEYVSANFDGSDIEVITEEEYNAINSEPKKIYPPIKYVDDIAEISQIEGLNGSKLFVKGFDNSSTDILYLACYDSNGILVGFAVALQTATLPDEYVEFRLSGVPQNADSVKLMYWNKNKPIDKFIEIK